MPLLGSPAKINVEANFLLNLQFEFNLSIHKSVMLVQRESKEQMQIKFGIENIMLGALGSPLLLALMVGRTQYLYKDYYKCIFADYNDINNDATLSLYNVISKTIVSHTCFCKIVSLLHRDLGLLFCFVFLCCP